MEAEQDFVDHSRRRTIRDPEVRRQAAGPQRADGSGSRRADRANSRRQAPRSCGQAVQAVAGRCHGAERVERSAASCPNAGRRGDDQRRADSLLGIGRRMPDAIRPSRCWTSKSRTCCCSKRSPRAKSPSPSRNSTTKSATRRKLAGVVDKDGKPDMEKWMQTATQEQGVTKDQYIRDSVWPSAALKKLTGSTIEVTNEDIEKGFEANYSERVRCRAIVLPNMRKAQEVWAKARQNTSMDYFGDLAAENSIEPSSKSLTRRSAADPQIRRSAAARRRGVRPEAGRAIRHHPAGRQIRDPQMRRPDEAGRSQSAGSPRRFSTRTSSRKSCGWR